MMGAMARRWLRIALLFGAGLGLRWAVAQEFHASAGDGQEYHRLARELRRAGRYAYGPPPAPLSYARMPGYPLLLALVEDPDDASAERQVVAMDRAAAADALVAGERGVDELLARQREARSPGFQELLLRGAHLNVLFDAVTALLVLATALEAGLGRRAAWLACGLALACPLLLLDCCYLLRESLATAMTMLTVYLLVRGMRRGSGRALVLAGAVAGATMLVRIDAVAIGAAFLPPLAALQQWRRRALFAVAALAATAAVFAPWPIRNQLRFGAPHVAGATWSNAYGDVFPTGGRDWMRTWMDDPHEGWLTFRLDNKMKVTARDLDRVPACYDYVDQGARAELIALFEAYNREGLSPAVDAALHNLALRRLRAHPLRVAAWLPLRRAFLWWLHFTPVEEQPLRSVILGQPAGRFAFELSSWLFFAGALAGLAILLRRSNTRPLAWLFLLAMASRTLLMSYASPDGCQRYLAPIYPLALIATAVAAVAAIDAVRRRYGR